MQPTGHFEVAFSFASVSKRSLLQNFRHENKFDFHENDAADHTHFHTNGFGLIIILHISKLQFGNSLLQLRSPDISRAHESMGN